MRGLTNPAIVAMFGMATLATTGIETMTIQHIKAEKNRGSVISRYYEIHKTFQAAGVDLTVQEIAFMRLAQAAMKLEAEAASEREDGNEELADRYAEAAYILFAKAA
jgi:hypothetical protein